MFMCTGLLLAGYLISRFKFPAWKLQVWDVIIGIIWVAILVVFAFLGCNSKPIHGLENAENGNNAMYVYINRLTVCYVTVYWIHICWLPIWQTFVRHVMLHKVSKFSLGFDPDGVLGGQICHDQCVNICLHNRTRRSSCIQIDKLLFNDWHMIVADVCKNIEQLEASNQSVIILSVSTTAAKQASHWL